MSDRILQVADDFWNIRGSFKIGGLVDIGTQASLVRLASGNYVLLDSYTLGSKDLDEILGIVGDAEIEAILNLHPFHTVHVEKVHRQFPAARLYGTARHLELFPELPWEEELTESAALHQRYVDDLDFTVPAGVDFISANDKIHFSSVLAMHRASSTLHVDDTIMYLPLPRALRWSGRGGLLAFHPTLSKALEKRAGAAAEFRDWAEQAFDGWRDVANLCAAHSSPLLAEQNRGVAFHERVQSALKKCAVKLAAHEKRYG